jgi:DNA-binding PadR family transcriptional regulator
VPDRFLPEFELYVLLAIARLEGEAYGARIRQEIEARTSRPTSIGALYATLGRLEDKGLVRHDTPEARPGERGRPRKYCHLTHVGVCALRHSTRMLGRMLEGTRFALGEGGR